MITNHTTPTTSKGNNHHHTKKKKETNLNVATKWSSLPSIKHSLSPNLLYVHFTNFFFFTSQIQWYKMKLKKATCVVLFAVACISTAMAHGGHHKAEAPITAEAPSSLSTPGVPQGGAGALDPFLAVSLLSFLAYYLQFWVMIYLPTYTCMLFCNKRETKHETLDPPTIKDVKLIFKPLFLF